MNINIHININMNININNISININNHSPNIGPIKHLRKVVESVLRQHKEDPLALVTNELRWLFLGALGYRLQMQVARVQPVAHKLQLGRETPFYIMIYDEIDKQLEDARLLRRRRRLAFQGESENTCDFCSVHGI